MVTRDLPQDTAALRASAPTPRTAPAGPTSPRPSRSPAPPPTSSPPTSAIGPGRCDGSSPATAARCPYGPTGTAPRARPTRAPRPTTGPPGTVGTGVGFVFGDGIGCLDLDDALDADRWPSTFAAAALAANPGAWVERSMSRRGLRVFCLLEEAPGRRLDGIETYSRTRFIALTGNVFRAGDLVPLVIPALD